MKQQELIKIAYKIKGLGESVKKQLGCGFDESIYQNALAIEFRRNNIKYLKEVNIEIFYRGESVGVDRPDFIITNIDNFRKPILLELKVADKISEDHKRQLKSYHISLPHNKNPILRDFAGGILLSFLKGDVNESGSDGTTLFCIDKGNKVLVDEQDEKKKK